jgi:lipopolysaccharide biosynthesis glycosyltransferase
LLLPDLLPRIDKILYLDVDLLVRDDVSVLFKIHTSSLIGACLDMYLPRAQQQVPNFERYNLKADDLVVNTGVCLLNLREIRKTALIEKSVQLLFEHAEDMSYVDQTAINIAFKGNIDFLPAEWNVFPHAIEKKWTSPVESIQPFASDVLTNPKIVHFVGGWKPWSRSENTSFSNEWRTDLYNSGWFRSEIELFVWVLKNRWNKKTLWQIWKWRYI